MFIITTQNNSIINATNFETLHIEKCEEKNKYAIVCNKYIVGYYSDVNYAINVLMWIGDTISQSKTDENINIVIPQEEVDDNGTKNTETTEQVSNEV